ncbi:RNA polymerase sigma factor [Streptococcus fryi]
MAIKWDDYETALIRIATEISYYLQKSGAKKADSEDIAQDILVKILESDLVLPYDKLRAWLYRSAIRAYIDKYRRDKTYHDIVQKAFFDDNYDNQYDDQAYAFLYEALEELTPKFAHAIDCYYFQGFSVKECAHILGLSQSTVKIHLYRGRQQLKAVLKEKGYHYEDI